MKNEKEILEVITDAITNMKEDTLSNYREAIEEENETEGHYQRGRFEALAEIHAYLNAVGLNHIKREAVARAKARN